MAYMLERPKAATNVQPNQKLEQSGARRIGARCVGRAGVRAARSAARTPARPTQRAPILRDPVPLYCSALRARAKPHISSEVCTLFPHIPREKVGRYAPDHGVGAMVGVITLGGHNFPYGTRTGKIPSDSVLAQPGEHFGISHTPV
ncbi:hypothetical protein Ddc_19173 [Ditylenchus destructor]|nr:hypothetical protein Ddc_19173 [Ditylenchus destructor]